jgi:Fe-S cluster assembly iron-binding protein IscA
MIAITERAKQELSKLLAEKVDWPGARLRLIDRGQGNLGLGIDIEAPGDHIVEYEGIKVLIVEPELAKNLQGITLDVDDTPEGAELVISEKRLIHNS